MITVKYRVSDNHYLWNNNIILKKTVSSFLLLLSHSCSNSLRPHGLQHIKLPYPSLSPGVCSDSCSLSPWCHPNDIIICCPLLLLPSESGSFPMSQLLALGGQIIGTSASASIFPMNIQGWFPLGLTGLLSLMSKRLSSIFSLPSQFNCQFFGTQPFLRSNSHFHIWLREKQ